MNNWKEALAQSIAEHQGAHRASIANEQYRTSECDTILLRASHPQAGMVHSSNTEHSYTVTNEHTFETQSDLTEEEVEQAMQDLNVADSLWYVW